MNNYLILVLLFLAAMWYVAGMYGGFLIFWAHQKAWQRTFHYKPAMTPKDAIFILLLFPICGPISLIMGIFIQEKGW
jgi:uncharacterized protein YneF (UPF0154 family)